MSFGHPLKQLQGNPWIVSSNTPPPCQFHNPHNSHYQPLRQPRSLVVVIGDFGSGDKNARAVADLVKTWKPNFIITVGDNNYQIGAADTIDQNVGQFYAEYITPYIGKYGPGDDQNAFFPSLGNHDWDSEDAKPTGLGSYRITYGQAKKPAGPIKIGGQGALSGAHADYGWQMMGGATMAIEEINCQGWSPGSQT